MCCIYILKFILFHIYEGEHDRFCSFSSSFLGIVLLRRQQAWWAVSRSVWKELRPVKALALGGQTTRAGSACRLATAGQRSRI